MDTKRLCSVLEEALKVIPSQDASIFGLTMANILMYQASMYPASTDPRTVELLQALRSEPELTVFDGTTIHTGANGPPAEYRHLAGWLMIRAMSVGVSQAVENLTTYLTVSELPCEMTLIVSGLEPEKACELGRGISFVPWEELRESSQKQSMHESLFTGLPFHSTVGALVREYTIKKLYVPQAEFLRDIEKYIPSHVDVSELNDALLCLALVGPYGPHILASWMSSPVWAPVYASGMALPLLEGFSPGAQISADGCSQARDLFAAFCAAPGQFQARLRLATQRLISAVRGTNPVDAAIDLGIALEVLYVNNKKRDKSSWLKKRAAQFLGATEAEQTDISTLMGDIYNTRSCAVHDGMVEPQKNLNGKTVQQVLEEGFSLTAKTIRRFITCGEPSW